MIKTVGGVPVQSTHRLSCHCGAVVLLKVVQGQESLRFYQFNTMVAKHYFCSKCGIQTHNQSRATPNEYRYNVGCLEGIDPFALGEVPTIDGVNHRSDRAT